MRERMKGGVMIDAEQLAILFHETYESLAPEFGYETRLETRVFDPYSSNGRLMIAVCQAIIGKLEADNARHENTIRNLDYEITELGDTIAALREKLHRIEVWADAYPLSVFPEPDFKHVRELLESGGITLDSVSASNMRHVLQGIKSILAE